VRPRLFTFLTWSPSGVTIDFAESTVALESTTKTAFSLLGYYLWTGAWYLHGYLGTRFMTATTKSPYFTMLRGLWLLSALKGASCVQPEAPPPKPAPLRELPWGQLNFLHTTDIHGWWGGHLQEYAISSPCQTQDCIIVSRSPYVLFLRICGLTVTQSIVLR